jgi:hypothetical protein
MSRERRAGRKAVIIGIAVLLLTAFFAYYLHLRPAEEATEPAPQHQAPAEDMPGQLPGGS